MRRGFTFRVPFRGIFKKCLSGISRCSSAPLPLLWRSSGATLVLHWRCSGAALAHLWHFSGGVLPLLWRCCGAAVALQWRFSGDAPTLLWQSLALLWR
jgi:hypothetical protein